LVDACQHGLQLHDLSTCIPQRHGLCACLRLGGTRIIACVSCVCCACCAFPSAMASALA
jgi:hypothetical protein